LLMNYWPVYDSSQDSYILYEDKGGNDFRFKVTTDIAAERPSIPDVNVRIKNNLFVAWVYDGVTARIFLDSTLQDTHLLTWTVSSGQIAYIWRNGTSSEVFSGTIKYLRIYNRALSDTEIQSLYNATK
jgi:hypothetical protein